MMKHNYKPLPDFLEIRDSEIHGQGLFAKKDIPSNYRLGISHIRTLDDVNFPNGLIRTPLSGHVNHSSPGNIRMFRSKENPLYWEFITIYDIKNGGELTIDYNTTPCGVINWG